MKNLLLILAIFSISCVSNEKKINNITEDSITIEREITEYHQALKRAYNGAQIDTDSLIDVYFDKDVYYVTYWGMSEPIDSTKSRLRRALPGIKDYENRLEGISVKVYGDGAYAFFILRQNYILNGILMDEYLPTTFVLERRGNRWIIVHSQRSVDFQTIQQLMQIAQKHESEIQQEE